MEKKYTPEDIEELKKQDPALLTPQERRLANLNPIKKGEVRNPKGAKKGVKRWDVHFKRLMGNEKLLKSIISSKPSSWDGIVDDIPADVIAAGVITTVTREVSKCVAEGKPIDKDTLRAIDTLNKLGWGITTNIAVDDTQGFFEKPQIVFTVVPDRPPEKEDTDTKTE